jgi:hypothetical protein
MGKLKDLVSAGVRLIITDTEAGEPKPAAEREIPPEAFDEPPPPASAAAHVPAQVEDFAVVYREAGIEAPAHGYGIDKVAEMLASPRLAALAREVRATAVLAALEAAGVAARDVIQDGVRRDRALDAFEAAKQRELEELRASAESRVKELLAEIDAFVKAKNAEVESLKKDVAAASDAFVGLSTRKRAEEDRLHEVVSHFVEGTESPITRSAAGSPPPPPKASGPA